MSALAPAIALERRRTPSERLLRWMTIMLLDAQGLCSKQIAYEYGVTAARVRMIINECGAAAE